MGDVERLALLRFLAAKPGGGFTQRDVAEALRVSKVQARRRLQAAVAEGLVEVALDESRSTPGRRVFSLRDPKGLAELKRLERGSH
ncbi:MAG: MarR family transcriptional regulator [Thermoleophilaceae bacterium]|nr:MarR family transcriptional regulator [Thermoleophilaceae bacterium]